MAICFRTVSIKRHPVSQFVSSRKHVGFRGPIVSRTAPGPYYISEFGFLRFLITHATPSSCCKRKTYPGCLNALFNKYSTLSVEVSDCKESFNCCIHESCDYLTHCKQADSAEKWSYLVLDSGSPGGKVSHDFRPVVLTVKSLETVSDDIILWDTEGIHSEVLKLECIQNHDSAFLSDVEKQMVLFVDENAKPTSRNVPESSGKPSEEQLLRVKQFLAESLPKLFIKPLEYSMYHQNIVFENNITGKRTVGLPEYMKQMSFLKIVGHFKFAYVKLELLKISMHPEDSSIKVRWRIRGITGLKVFTTFWKFKLWKIKEVFEEQEAWYDGFSTFYVGQDGLIHKHVADKMMPDSDRVAVEEQKSNIAAKLALFAGFVVRPSLIDMLPLVFDKQSKSSSAFSDMTLPMHRLE